ncbi:MAG: AAA family ATPase [Prevotella sp.]|nr:AAA family ATPase [Prevotella sp.]
MIADELKYRIQDAFGLQPTAEQQQAIDTFARFMTDRREESVMVMRGSAGTGKTTLAAAMVQVMVTLKQKILLMSPTGRAAKVLALYANHPAYTIHRRIYRQKSLEGSFDLNFNSASDTLFVVDEASMIANGSDTVVSTFGSGRLLDDLIRFVYNGRNCRLLIIGDHAQLPPVGELESAALSAGVLRSYGLHVYECTLSDVMRQSLQSGILYNATCIRREWLETAGGAVPLPQIQFQGFADIHMVPGDELIESLSSSYSHVGLDDTIVVTRSNKRANIYNQGIRNQVLGREDELCSGDRLMIVKNNYYWAAPTNMPQQGEAVVAASASSGHGRLDGGFIANGDMAVVRRVRNVHEQYGFRFADVTLSFPDYDDYELTANVLLSTLTSDAPSLTREQQEQLYNKVMEDYEDVPLKADRLKKLKEDRYYNALQVKFAYAATCHKVQGGQWAHVYIDQGYMTDEMLGPDYLHWLYTALTRATEQLYLVNWPKTQTINYKEI